MNKIHPGMIPRINKRGSPSFLLIENITMFIKSCEKLGTLAIELLFSSVEGIPKSNVFDGIDLFEEKNIPKVVNCLLQLEDAARRMGFKPLMRHIEDDPQSMPELSDTDLLRAHMLLEQSDSGKEVIRS